MKIVKKKTVDEVVGILAIFSNSKTRTELMEYVAERKDFFMFRMAETCVILKDMK